MLTQGNKILKQRAQWLGYQLDIHVRINGLMSSVDHVKKIADP